VKVTVNFTFPNIHVEACFIELITKHRLPVLTTLITLCLWLLLRLKVGAISNFSLHSFFTTNVCILNQFVVVESLRLWLCHWLQEGSTYGQLFVYALRAYGILCIGLYRLRDMPAGISHPSSSKRYVITNPPSDFLLLASDKVRPRICIVI